ncbi:MAG TPA: YicC/YloC family endoribonuclease [Burkholderiales bacterium]|nr:YicC/YloC family endoribonuclease [Burkholderiales bacterium]
MIHSMTGYAAISAALSADGSRGTLSIELRSVNSRFLDLQFRIGDELRSVEPVLRELIAGRVSRGKLECRLYLNESVRLPQASRLSAEALERLGELAAEVQRALPQATPLRVADVLRWPGVIAEPTVSEDETRQLAAELCRKALDELVASRKREGAKLAAAIAERVAGMRRRIEQAAPLVPQSIAAYQARLSEKLREALGSNDDDRVRTELAVFAAKVDVDEELTRLRTHLDEVERILRQGGDRSSSRSSSDGKRLDFIAQELNREANTLASKAAGQEITDCALELKLLIEQIREQVQNIE